MWLLHNTFPTFLQSNSGSGISGHKTTLTTSMMYTHQCFLKCGFRDRQRLVRTARLAPGLVPLAGYLKKKGENIGKFEHLLYIASIPSTILIWLLNSDRYSSYRFSTAALCKMMCCAHFIFVIYVK